MNILQQRRTIPQTPPAGLGVPKSPQVEEPSDFDLVKDGPARSPMQEFQNGLDALAKNFLEVEQSTSALVYSYGRLLVTYAPAIVANPAVGVPLLLGKASVDLFYRLGMNGGIDALARAVEAQAAGYGPAVKKASMAALQLLSFYANPQAKIGGLAGVALTSALSRWVVPTGWDNAQFYLKLLGYICGAEAGQGTFGGAGTTAVQSSEPVDPAACNESKERCSLHWTEAAFPTTHNSEALPHDLNAFTIPFVGKISIPYVGRYFSNQVHPVKQQLDDGIRGFMLDYSLRNGTLESTHNDYFDYGALTNVLGEMKSFLDQNPREVILLNLESTQFGPLQPLIDALKATGLHAYLPKQRSDYELNMGEMIDRGIRCIVMAHGAYEFHPDPGIHRKPNNPGQVGGQSGRSGTQNSFNSVFGPWDCPPKAEPGTPVVLNHFSMLGGFPGGQYVAEAINENLQDHLEQCKTALGRDVTMVAVDHYHTSNVVEISKPEGSRLKQPQERPA